MTTSPTPASPLTDEHPVARATYLPLSGYHDLNVACLLLASGFGQHLYLVGSATRKSAYRDVDVRCILPDEEFDALFPGVDMDDPHLDAKRLAMNQAFSAYLAQQSRLPIDFQFQRQTQANVEFPGGSRNALGICDWRKPPFWDRRAT